MMASSFERLQSMLHSSVNVGLDLEKVSAGAFVAHKPKPLSVTACTYCTCYIRRQWVRGAQLYPTGEGLNPGASPLTMPHSWRCYFCCCHSVAPQLHVSFVQQNCFKGRIREQPSSITWSLASWPAPQRCLIEFKPPPVT